MKGRVYRKVQKREKGMEFMSLHFFKNKRKLKQKK